MDQRRHAAWLLVAAAAYGGPSQEWRSIQERYQARPAGAARYVHLRQVVVPALRGRGSLRELPRRHGGRRAELARERRCRRTPDVGHDPARFGCTACHGGQGRATEKADAHGDVERWPEPMIPRRYAYAGCGICHTHLPFRTSTSSRGAARFRAATTASPATSSTDAAGRCGRGAAEVCRRAPDCRAGGTGYVATARAGTSDGPRAPAFGEIPAADRAAIECCSIRASAPRAGRGQGAVPLARAAAAATRSAASAATTGPS